MGHQKSKRESRSRVLPSFTEWHNLMEGKRTVLEVHWVDSETDDDWQDLASYKPRRDPLDIVTLGYLIDDNKTNIVIARSITKDTLPLLEGVFCIPRCSIIKIKKVKVYN